MKFEILQRKILPNGTFCFESGIKKRIMIDLAFWMGLHFKNSLNFCLF